MPTVAARFATSAITMPRRSAGVAPRAGLLLFLDGDHRLGLDKLGLQPGVLARQTRHLGGQRIDRCGLWAGCLRSKRVIPARQALPPFGDLGRIQAVTAQQGTTAGVATRVGIVFVENNAALRTRQG